jgi:sporulation protein YlmC with PRC-barrel domain
MAWGFDRLIRVTPMRPALVFGALTFLAASSWAAAQTSQPAPGAAPGGSPAPSQTGWATSAATMPVRFVEVQPADVLASNLIGSKVYNNQNENIGEIQDLAVEGGRTVRAVIIGIGGFLGVGERYAAVDPSSILLSRQESSWRAVMNISRDELKNAPAFKYDRSRP